MFCLYVYNCFRENISDCVLRTARIGSVLNVLRNFGCHITGNAFLQLAFPILLLYSFDTVVPG
jgi:hypothetical protein